ncbi:unnamed protein product [Phytophthora lilii]|uniref:Unnamed protein product n=1 Tax=Phytophthora lilii TaxID=2077276 RepID=A0A9W7D9A8_9STRA|nr:unnamed protein product [Phytophthora lilii]
MTLNAGSQPLALTNYTRPTPPSKASLGRVAPVIKPDSSAGKRFTVRDGFHLKTRNAEVQAAIDAQITAQLAAREESPYLLPQSKNDESATNITLGPAKHEVNSAIPPCKALKPHERSTTNQEDRAKELEGGSDRSAAIVLTQLLEPELVNHIPGRANIRGRTPVKVHAVLKAPADWLIYRDRPSETKHGKQRKIDKLLLEMLRDPQPPKVLNAKLDEVLEPRRSRCQSVLGSTYSERVAAARPAKHTSSEHKHHHRDRLQPLTETERGLLRSREDNNMAVDKLLVSLFHPPSASTQHTATSSLGPIVKTTTSASRFSTRRSIIRHETAVALRSRKLVSRMNELRSLPQLLQQMESLQLWKKQQHIAEHGVDIVARNRANPTLQVLQKPSQTPVLPSATDHKVHQANKRKQELDAAKEENVRRIVVRWQVRREQRAEQARRIHVQSQWLLIVALAESSHTWLTKFHEFRQKRSVLARIIMAKRLQRYWRQRALVKRNSLQLLRFAPSTPLSSAFFRMPVVIHAVTKLQQSIRDWLEQKHYRERKDAISLIVTAWFEFQDVKFRRIILRFRKRVRDFQVMWRAWRAITAARIKLLLLVWAKLERKVKRRHGVTSSHISVTFALGSDGPQLKTSNAAGSESLSSGKGLTLLDMLQRTVIERPLNQPKQLEDMHRHFRNGGAVHMPISAHGRGVAARHARRVRRAAAADAEEQVSGSAPRHPAVAGEDANVAGPDAAAAAAAAVRAGAGAACRPQGAAPAEGGGAAQAAVGETQALLGRARPRARGLGGGAQADAQRGLPLRRAGRAGGLPAAAGAVRHLPAAAQRLGGGDGAAHPAHAGAGAGRRGADAAPQLPPQRRPGRRVSLGGLGGATQNEETIQKCIERFNLFYQQVQTVLQK